MRRLTPLCLAAVVLTGVVVVLPVVAPPGPESVPVRTSSHEVELGSVDEPAADAEVKQRPAAAVPGLPEDADVLSVTRDEVPEFSLVGVTWPYDPAVTDTLVQVRVRDGSGAWGPWTQVQAEGPVQDADAPTPAVARVGTEPLWTGPSRGVQVELVTRSGAAPDDVRLDLIDPGTSAADDVGEPAITDTANAAVTMPAVYGRAQWGADESLRTWDPEYAPRLRAATIHHTAGSNDYTRADVAAIMRSIYRYHAVSLRWGDIGYNVLVDKFGRLWEGRAGGLGRAPIGAHAGGFNTGTVGISWIGNYDVVGTPSAMIDATASFLRWKLAHHGIDPRGSVTLTSSGGGTSRYASGEKVTLPTVFAHRDVGSTACPGRYGFAQMSTIRNRVATGTIDVWRIRQRYDSDAALRTSLGAEVSAPTLTPGGTGGFAVYQRGSLYYSPTTGVRHVPAGAVRTKWSQLSWERGPLGYPTSDVRRTPDGAGWFGHFQGGSVYWSQATGAHLISGALRNRWGALGWQTGALGYPRTDQRATPDGGAQYVHFQHGSMYWSPATGARAVSGDVLDAWAAAGWERSWLGLPVSDVGATSDGEAEVGHFQAGSVLAFPTGVDRLLPSLFVQAWSRTGAEQGPLGYPVGDVLAAAGGSGEAMPFEDGGIYAREGVARVVTGDVATGYDAAGGPGGDLGWPTTDVAATPDGGARFAHFQRGSIYAVGGTPRVLPPPVVAAWRRSGWERGPLGYPASDVVPTAGGRVMTFADGSVFVDGADRSFVLDGAVEDAYLAVGGSAGSLGFPRGDVRGTPDGRGRFAHFPHGSIYWTATTGARVVSGPVKDRWVAAGWERGLGYPTTDVTATPDGLGAFAHFERGSVYSTTGTGARIVAGAFKAAWARTGWERGSLGYPTGEARAVTGGRQQDFQRGWITVSSATGKATVTIR